MQVKNSKSKMFRVLIGLVAAGMVLSGCGKESPAQHPNSGGNAEKEIVDNNSASNPYAEHMDISIAYWDIGTKLEERDEALQMLEEKFNITFKSMQVGWSDYDQKFQMWASSGTLPDVFAHAIGSDNPGVYADWAKQGMIRALPDDLSNYPHVQKIADLEDVQSMKRDGKLYNLPRLNYSTNDQWVMDRAVYVRKDWMETLGLSDPQSFDEFSAMMKAFAEQDPDGNSKHDTIGLTINVKPELLLGSTFPQYVNGSWVKENGEWKPMYVSEKMTQVAAQLRKLYTDGGLDRDFAIMKVGEGKDKFLQGRAGAYEAAATPGDLKSMSEQWSQYNPDKKFLDSVKLLRLWPDEEGNRYRFTTTTYWSESYFSPQVSDAKMDRILSIYDYLLSEEGRRLSLNGIEGKDYVMEGDTIKVTRAIDENTGQPVAIGTLYPSLSVLSNMPAWHGGEKYEDTELNRSMFGEENWQTSLDEYHWLMENAMAIPTNYDIFAMSTPSKDKLSAINYKDDLFRVILSKEDPVEMWNDIVKEYEAKGVSEAIAEVNAELDKLGRK